MVTQTLWKTTQTLYRAFVQNKPLGWAAELSSLSEENQTWNDLIWNSVCSLDKHKELCKAKQWGCWQPQADLHPRRGSNTHFQLWRRAGEKEQRGMFQGLAAQTWQNLIPSPLDFVIVGSVGIQFSNSVWVCVDLQCPDILAEEQVERSKKRVKSTSAFACSILVENAKAF